MQKYRPIQGQQNVFETRLALNENFESIASSFAGDAFPTSNLFVGMKFYHTGEKKTYTLRQLDPVRWDEDTPDRLKNARNISLTGKVQSATVGFDGTADIALQVTRVEADVCNGNAASATIAASVKGAISSQNAPRHVWFSGANNETQREYANNFVYNPVTGTLAVPKVEGTASLASRAFTADRASADGNGANIAATYAPKNGAGAYGTWGINIGGRAEVANVADRVGNDDASMRFHWNGQGGQPTWLWGGNSPGDAYVWNPSNFNVNYANKSARADSAGWADGAQQAKSAECADNATNFNGHSLANILGLIDAANTGAVEVRLNENGYIKIRNGLMLQWGVLKNVKLIQSEYDINFAKPFNNSCFNILLTLVQPIFVSATNNVYVKTGTITKTGFKVIIDHSVEIYNGDVFWVALGV